MKKTRPIPVEADALGREALDILVALLGTNHSNVLPTMGNLQEQWFSGGTFRAAHQARAAEALFSTATFRLKSRISRVIDSASPSRP
jgi:hypothetical protein